MITHRNLDGRDAVNKLRELVGNTPTCMFGSGLGGIPMHLCPMHVQQADPQGCLWFFSAADSAHNQQIMANPWVQLVFCNPSRTEYLSIFGETFISNDPVKIRALWNQSAEAWFPEGQADPNLTVLCVRPVSAHYWDTEEGRLASLAKVLNTTCPDADCEISPLQ